MVNTILAKRVNYIVAKGDHPVWPKGSKSRGFSIKGGSGNVDTHQRPLSFDKFCEQGEKRVVFLFHFPHEFIADCRRSDRFIVLGEFHVDLEQILPHEIEERVDVCGFLGTSCGTVIFRIPDFDAHFVFGAELASASVDGQTNVYDRLSLCIDFVFSNEEKNLKSAFHNGLFLSTKLLFCK